MTWVEKSTSKDVTVLAEMDEDTETGRYQYWYPDRIVQVTPESYESFDIPSSPEPVIVSKNW